MPPDGPWDPGWTDPLPDILENLDPGSIFDVLPGLDWVTAPNTVLQFDEAIVGQGGHVDPGLLEGILARPGTATLDVDAGGEVSLHADGAGLAAAAEIEAAAETAGIVGTDVSVALDGPAVDEVLGGGGALNVVTGSGLGTGALSNIGADINIRGGGGFGRP